MEAGVKHIVHLQRTKSWRYTEAGWFFATNCAFRNIRKSREIVDGSVLIRVKPMSEENRQASRNMFWASDIKGN